MYDDMSIRVCRVTSNENVDNHGQDERLEGQNNANAQLKYAVRT